MSKKNRNRQTPFTAPSSLSPVTASVESETVADEAVEDSVGVQDVSEPSESVTASVESETVADEAVEDSVGVQDVSEPSESVGALDDTPADESVGSTAVYRVHGGTLITSDATGNRIEHPHGSLVLPSVAQREDWLRLGRIVLVVD